MLLFWQPKLWAVRQLMLLIVFPVFLTTHTLNSAVCFPYYSSVPYDTFDILQDQEVREGLKIYSNWPTYPQVYVNTELIGGLDIIKELQVANKLIPTLDQPPSSDLEN
ncbi:hypothetical protein M8J77_016504 [Diaphorina citri]|nr:hypothetical protein M8J77_016504 [Diaphorina citri]